MNYALYSKVVKWHLKTSEQWQKISLEVLTSEEIAFCKSEEKHYYNIYDKIRLSGMKKAIRSIYESGSIKNYTTYFGNTRFETFFDWFKSYKAELKSAGTLNSKGKPAHESCFVYDSVKVFYCPFTRKTFIYDIFPDSETDSFVTLTSSELYEEETNDFV